MNFDITKSLEELEGKIFEQSDFNSSLILSCQELMKKKIIDFSVEDLRVMIGQGIGLKYLIPLALDKLVNNPFVSGDFFNGDLLTSVLRVDRQFWKRNEDLLIELREIIYSAKITIETVLPLLEDYESYS